MTARQALIAAMLLSSLLVACGARADTPATGSTGAAPAGTGGPVVARLTEWLVVATPSAAKAGTVAFRVRNEGALPHDFVVIRSDLAANRLPTAGGIVDEQQVTVVKKGRPLTPGDSEEISVDLPKGRYVLICNVIGHYNSGQFAAFSVE